MRTSHPSTIYLYFFNFCLLLQTWIVAPESNHDFLVVVSVTMYNSMIISTWRIGRFSVTLATSSSSLSSTTLKMLDALRFFFSAYLWCLQSWMRCPLFRQWKQYLSNLFFIVVSLGMVLPSHFLLFSHCSFLDFDLFFSIRFTLLSSWISVLPRRMWVSSIIYKFICNCFRVKFSNEWRNVLW